MTDDATRSREATAAVSAGLHPPRPSASRTWMSTVAGALTVCAGVSSLIGAGVLALLAISAWMIPEAAGDAEPWPFAVGFALLSAISFLLGAIGAVALAGGLISLRHRGGVWPILGAIAATLVSLPLGVAAIVLTVLSERETESASGA